MYSICLTGFHFFSFALHVTQQTILLYCSRIQTQTRPRRDIIRRLQIITYRNYIFFSLSNIICAIRILLIRGYLVDWHECWPWRLRRLLLWRWSRWRDKIFDCLCNQTDERLVWPGPWWGWIINGRRWWLYHVECNQGIKINQFKIGETGTGVSHEHTR